MKSHFCNWNEYLWSLCLALVTYQTRKLKKSVKNPASYDDFNCGQTSCLHRLACIRRHRLTVPIWRPRWCTAPTSQCGIYVYISMIAQHQSEESVLAPLATWFEGLSFWSSRSYEPLRNSFEIKTLPRLRWINEPTLALKLLCVIIHYRPYCSTNGFSLIQKKHCYVMSIHIQ